MITNWKSPRPEANNTVVRWVIETRNKLERRIEYRKSVQSLRSLNDRMLKDIGIGRSEINALVYGPVNQLPKNQT